MYHTDVRWLSCGHVFARVVEFRGEILEFLKHQQSSLVNNFEDEHFIVSLGYLADIFSLLNDFNMSMQGKDVNIIQARGKRVEFMRKLSIWSCCIEKQNGKTLSVEILQEVKNHLDVLSTNF